MLTFFVLSSVVVYPTAIHSLEPFRPVYAPKCIINTPQEQANGLQGCPHGGGMKCPAARPFPFEGTCGVHARAEAPSSDPTEMRAWAQRSHVQESSEVGTPALLRFLSFILLPFPKFVPPYLPIALCRPCWSPSRKRSQVWFITIGRSIPRTTSRQPSTHPMVLAIIGIIESSSRAPRYLSWTGVVLVCRISFPYSSRIVLPSFVAITLHTAECARR